MKFRILTIATLLSSLFHLSGVKAQYGPLYWDLRGYDSIADYRKAMHAFSNKDLAGAIHVLDSVNTLYVKQKDHRKQDLVQNEKAAMYYISKEYATCHDILRKNMERMGMRKDTLNYEYAISLRFMGYLANAWKEMKTQKAVFIERQSSVLNAMNDSSAIYADCLSDLGLAYIYSNPEKGMDYLLRAKPVAKKNGLANSLLIIDNTLTNKLSKEQPHLSLKIQQCLFNTASRKYHRDSTTLIMLAYHVGVKSREIGAYEEAIRYLDIAGDLMKATNNPFYKLISAIPIEKIQCYSQMGDQKMFVSEVGKTLELYYLTSQSKNWPEYHMLSMIGINYLAFDADSALVYLDKAKGLLLKEEEKDVEVLGQILTGEALACQKLGRFSEAVALILESIKLYTGEDDHKQPNFICPKENDDALKQIYLVAGEVFANHSGQNNTPVHLDLAVKSFFCCDTIMRRLAINISDENAILTYAKEYKKMTTTLLDIPNYPNQNPGIAFHFVTNSKAFQLVADIKRHAYLQKFAPTDSLWFAKNELQKSLYRIRKQADEALRHSEKMAIDSLAILEKDLLVDLIVLNYKLMKAQDNPNQYFDNDHISNNIQANIGDSSLIIDLFQTPKQVFLFCINRDGVACTALPEPQKLDLLANQLFKEVKTGDKFNGTAQSISNFLFKPISGKIASSKHLVIIPDNMLYQIPFELLPNPKTGKIFLYSHAISYHYSSALWLKSQIKTTPKTHHLLSIAPVFGDDNTTAFTSEFREDHEGDPYLVEMGKGKISPLPFTLDEVKGIADLFARNGVPYNLLINEKATKDNLFQYGDSISILHIATHGYVSKTSPKNSGFFLYANDHHFGFVNMGEVYHLNTQADLAVLSACNSGVGPVYEGEGLMALPRGFIYAGVPNVMASLWKVHDAKTKELMLLFYHHLLLGNQYAEALRKAKLECIRKGFLPLDWAGFVMIGR